MLVGTRHTEIVRRAFNLFEVGEIDALVALYHRDVEIRVTAALGAPAQTYVGVDSVRPYLQDLVTKGKNSHVDDLDLMEVGNSVLVRGWVAAPMNLAMRWQFDFEGGRITRVVPLEGDWAVLNDRGFTLGHVAQTPRSGRVELLLGDGRSLVAPIATALKPRAAVHEPVLAYFDRGRLAGWYLPHHQEGMDLR